MAIYRADQAVVTFASEAGQGGYPESAALSSASGTSITNAIINPGDRTVSINAAYSGGANNDTFIVVGDDSTTMASASKGPKEIRKVVAGANTTSMTVDSPFGFYHASGALVQQYQLANEGTGDPVTAQSGGATAGKYISNFPGVYESVDVPDPEQAFEPRYVLGGLTNRNFYEMYKGQETLSGSIGSMVLLNGFPLRFPIGTVQTLPIHNVSLAGSSTGANVVGWSDSNTIQKAWSMGAGGSKKGDVIIPIDKGSGNAALNRGTYLVFGFASTLSEANIQGICDGGFDQFTSTSTYEIRQVVSNHTGDIAYAARLNAPLHFDHAEDERIVVVSSAADAVGLGGNGSFIHKIQETTSLDSVTWNVSIPDSDGTNIWQRRYMGGKVGSLSLSAEEGGLLTAGWDGVQFLDMVHNVKQHYSLGTTQKRMPRYTAMHELTVSDVGRMTQTAGGSDEITYTRPDTQPYYFSNGTVQFYGNVGDQTQARVRNFALNVSNGEEPRYYIRRNYEGRRSPHEIFEGNREYTMTATIATPDSANQSTATAEADTIDLWRELMLAGDYRNSGGHKGFGIRLTFTRDDINDNNDFIRLIIPNDGTAAAGGNEQGAFIRTAPHNIGTDNPIQADADIQFRSMAIEIRDGEPMYP